jgi:DNA polymerase-3 subunit epsilon
MSAAAPAPVPWHLLPGPLVMIDLETTGVAPGRDRIIEITAVRQAPGQRPVVIDTLIDHGGPSAGPTAVHGITRRMLDGAPAFAEVLPALRALCEGATMVAHNASFEDGFLSAEAARCGAAWGLPRLCTLALSRRLHPERKKGLGHKLGGMAELYEVPVKDAHRALGDVRMMSALLGAMLRRWAEDERLPRFLAESYRVGARAAVWPAGAGAPRLWPRERAG